MNITKHTKYIWQIDDLIKSEECDNFLSLFDNTDVELIHEFRSKTRQNDTYDITSHYELNSIGWDMISRAHETYFLENMWIWYKWNKEKLYDKNDWYGKNILRMYGVNDCYHWHQDISPYNVPEVSYVIYLNDDYEGGHTMFLNDRLKVIPKKGSVLCFPVDTYHIHKSSRIKSGRKKIIWNCLFRKLVHNLQGGEQVDDMRTIKTRNIW